MLKRAIGLCLLVVLMLSVVGAVPSQAAPVAQASAAPNANLLPADTALYVDFRSADLTKTLTLVGDLIQKVTGQSVGDPYVIFDQGLTQVLGRPATVEKDILSWLGDNITFALPITDEQLSAVSSGSAAAMKSLNNPNYLLIISVKDDALAASFLKELGSKASPGSYTTRTDTINGASVTIADQQKGCNPVCLSLVQAKGFLALGPTSGLGALVKTLKTKGKTLADDANFTQVTGLLKSSNLLTAYISPRLYQVLLLGAQVAMEVRQPVSSFGAATPDAPRATMAATQAAGGMNNLAMTQAALKIIKGQAFAARIDGKVLALDVAQAIDPQAAADLYKQFGMAGLSNLNTQAITAKLANQISGKAVAVLIASNLPMIYTTFKTAFTSLQNVGQQLNNSTSGADIDEIARAFNQIEAALKLGFNLDLQQDVFSWMNGEFALYMTYNPNSVLMKMSSSSSSPWPFDHTLLIQSSDKDKTLSFLTKLNTGLKNNKVTVNSAGDNLYSITPSSSSTPVITYGLAGDTFLISTSSGADQAVAAIKGTDTLSANTAWKNAQASFVNPTGQVWFMNLTQVSALVKAMAAMNTTSSASERANVQQALNALDLLESATITGGVMQPNGTSLSSAQIILK